MSNELQRLTNYSGAGNQNVSMHFLQKEELDWFLASTADTFCQQQLFRRYKGEMYMLQQMEQVHQCNHFLLEILDKSFFSSS